MEDRIRQQWKPGHAHGGHRPPPPGLAAQAVHSADEAEFLRAMAAYQERTGRKFPTWSEALAVLKGLGYRKVDGGGATG
jgi:hypothetical protein